MENKIQKHEMLYRAVKRSKPEWLDDEEHATSYMFKDEKIGTLQAFYSNKLQKHIL